MRLKNFVGGYGFKGYVIPDSKNGEDVDAMIAEAVVAAMEKCHQWNEFKLAYLTDEQLNKLDFKIARKMQNEYDLETVKLFLTKRFNSCFQQGMMLQEVINDRLSKLCENDIRFGLQIWAEELLDIFDKNYQDAIEKALNDI